MSFRGWGWVGLVGALGCGPGPRGNVDAGAPACTTNLVYLPVHVLSATGAPAGGATVTANNPALGRSTTGQTDANGLNGSVTEELGPGQVTVKATLGSKVSETKTVSWTCSECHCEAAPASLSLTLSP